MVIFSYLGHKVIMVSTLHLNLMSNGAFKNYNYKILIAPDKNQCVPKYMTFTNPYVYDIKPGTITAITHCHLNVVNFFTMGVSHSLSNQIYREKTVFQIGG